MIKVSVQNVAGHQLLLDVDPQTKVLDVKAMVNEHWQIPAACQNILSGMSVLQDATPLLSCGQYMDDPMLLTVLVTLDGLVADLACNHWLDSQAEQKQLAALGSLAEFGPRAGKTAIDALSSLLHDGNAYPPNHNFVAPPPDGVIIRSRSGNVRAEAVRVLSLLVDSASADIIDIICACLLDGDPRVQDAASQALGRFKKEGEQEDVIAAIFREVQHLQFPSRHHFLDHYQDFPEFLDCDSMLDGETSNLIDAAMFKSYDRGDSVMIKALRAVGGKGVAGAMEVLDHKVVRACISHLSHKVSHVRRVALKALAYNAAAANDANIALEVAIRRLPDPAKSVRLAALQALTTFKQRWDQKVVVAVAGRVKDLDSHIRRVALALISEFAEKGDLAATAAVSSCLTDPDWCIRQEAVQILSELAEKGDFCMVRDLTANLRWWNAPQVATVLLGCLHQPKSVAVSI